MWKMGKSSVFKPHRRHVYWGAFVDPAHQGKGVGRALVEDAKGRYPQLTLAVYAQNTGAIGFYQQMGFQVVTEQPNEDSGLPELLMAWQREN